MSESEEAHLKLLQGPSAYPELFPSPQETEAEAPHYTDWGNARRLIERHGDDLRFVPAWQSWLVWDGRRWGSDETGEVARLAKDTVKSMYTEATGIENDDERKALVSWAKSSENERKIKPMITSAATEPEVVARPNDFDADPYLFNCANGTLDLRTGALREHRRADHISKLSPVVFDHEASSERWDQFLVDLTGGDSELEAFMKRAVGYALTGDTSEEVLFMLLGPTNSGKSTFIDAINGALGDYGVVADFESFLARRFVGGIRNDIARLAGARFVSSVEVDEGKKLAEGLIKMITGGDVVTARMLYQEAFEFRPQFKLFMAANHPPQVSDGDDAMWRRIRRVNCDHTVPAERVDKSLKPELRGPKRGGPAVLAWAVQGCLEWQREGLGMPPVIEQATQDYREEMDPLSDFIEDCCILLEGTWVISADLWDAYESWAKDNGEKRLLTRRGLGQRLKDRGCIDDRLYVGGRQQRCWVGIGLADDMKNPPPGGEQDAKTQQDARSRNFAYGESCFSNNTEVVSTSVLCLTANDDQPYKNTVTDNSSQTPEWTQIPATACEVCGTGPVMMRDPNGVARHPRCKT